MSAEWLIVLNADGTVLAVDGGAPEEWIGTRVEERPDRSVQASGLALRLVQDVFTAHGGAVQIESRTDAAQSGTTVRLTLPCR